LGELLSPYARQLIAWGHVVPRNPGRIGSRQRCKVCGGTHYEVRGEGQGRWLWCAACKQFPAQSFEIVLRWGGSTLRLGYDANGRRLVSFVDAEAALAQIRAEIKDAVFEPRRWASPKANHLLWEHYLAAYLERERKRLLPATWDVIRRRGRHLAKAFPGRNIREIRQGHVDDWVQGPLRDSGLGATTQAHICSTLRRLFALAVERQDIKQAPRVPSPQAAPRAPISWLLPDEQALALARDGSGTHFDPRVVDAFLRMIGDGPGTIARA
jgi:hypothetical protein